MKRKQLLLCLTPVVVVFFIRKIPLEVLFQHDILLPYAGHISQFLLNVIVILGCFVLALKTGLRVFGGFSKPIRKNYWMLVLPLLFPGLLFSGGSESGCPAAANVVVVTLALTFSGAILEEVLFRGVIMGYLRKQNTGMSAYTICILAALVFALAHLTNLQHDYLISVFPQVIYAFYMGLLFSALLFRTNNVWLLGCMHGLLNMITQKCSQPGNEPLSTDQAAVDFSDYLLQIGGFALLLSPVLLIFWVLMKKRPKS